MNLVLNANLTEFHSIHGMKDPTEEETKADQWCYKNLPSWVCNINEKLTSCGQTQWEAADLTNDREQ